MRLLVIAIYNLTLLIGTAYLVQNYNWSLGTFILTFCLLVSSK